MAAVVESHFAIELRTDVGDAEYIHEEAREFMSFCRQFAGFQLVWLSLEEIRVKNLDHRNAGSRRPYNDLGIPEGLHGNAGCRSGFVPIAGVEWWLTAAALALGKEHLMSKSFKHTHARPSHIRVELVDEAGNEERNTHGQ